MVGTHRLTSFPLLLLLVGLALPACDSTEDYFHRLYGPTDVAMIAPGGVFEVPVAYATNFRNGHISKLDLKRIDLLVEESAVAWQAAPDLAISAGGRWDAAAGGERAPGFEVGAADYVTKPFSVKVLLERIKALLRRRSRNTDDRSIVTSQGVEVDRERHLITMGDRRLDLTSSEFDLLDTLIRQPGRAFTRSELIDAALDGFVLERTIDVHIRSIRKKLGSRGSLIETVRGVGYRFSDPRIEAAQPSDFQ